ncbi:MAG: PKD domain-containing protein [Myxococcales bacterium]|nr:PKD domain-containing protein [Myxococcales bacterium]
MKRFILIGVTAAFLLFATLALAGRQWVKYDGSIAARQPAIQIHDNSAADFAFRLHIPAYQITALELAGETWQQIDFPGAAMHSTPGEPQLPVYTRWIAVPQGATPSVTVTVDDRRTLKGVRHLPAQIPPTDCAGEPDPDFSYDEGCYDSKALFPGRLYSVEGPFTLRGLRLIRLDLYPVQYNPVDREAELLNDLEVKIQFAGGKGVFFSDRRGDAFQSLYDTAMNHQAFANEPRPALTGKSPTGAEFVILSAPHLVDAAQDLADWKILQGYDIEVYTTDDSGLTCSEVKAWVQEAYDTWDPAPEFILFFGDSEFINPCYQVYDYGEYIGSDIHFVQVDGGDVWPDIAGARISVDTLAEAQKHVNDIINYERDPIVNDSYYTNAYTAAYFQPAFDGYEERRFLRTTEEVYQWFNHVMPDSPFTAHRIYTTDSYYSPLYWEQTYYNWTPSWWSATGYDSVNIPPDLLRANGFAWDGDAADITAAVNAGTVFLTHRDHGEEIGWSDPSYYLSDVQALANGDLQPVVWSVNCLTGYFDNETAGASHSECFTEGWERNPNGGSVGIIGSTRVSYSGRNDRMFWAWLDSMWPDFEPDWPISGPNDPEWRMGIVLTYGKIYLDHYYSGDPYEIPAITEFHWFGDPTMEMWAGVPGTLTVSHLPLMPMGATGFDVEVDADGARVALVQNGLILGKGYSSGGTAHIAFDGPVTDIADVHLTITRHSYRPYETDILVGAISDGIVRLDHHVYVENSTVQVSLSDIDLTGLGTFVLHIDSDTESAGEDVTCTELEVAGDPTGSFFGEIDLTAEAPGKGDGALSVGDGDTITVYYHDEDTGAGSPADKTDTAYADTAPPTFAGIANAVGGDHRVTLSWAAATDLTPPITYQIYRAETSGGQSFAVPLATVSNTTYLDANLPNLVEYFYVVRATDSLGHQDANTVEAATMTIGAVTIWEEDFDPDGIPDTWDTVNGGSLLYTWSDQNPGGRSSSYWSGLFAMADSDNSGSGAPWNDSLTTETIDCTGYTDVRLLLTHEFNWVSGYGDDSASIEISNDDGATWNSVAYWNTVDRSGLEDLPVGDWADNQASVKFRFTYTGNYDYWWGIDNLELVGMASTDAPTVSDITADVTTGEVPLAVKFAAQTSGLVSSYEWDFGDGQTSTEAQPTHTYEAVGVYSVSVTIENVYGSDTLTKDDFITAECTAPTVDFSADQTAGEAPLAVQFSDLSTYLTGCEPLQVEWDFGDGETSDAAQPAHTYAAAGTYTVSLTYTMQDGGAAYTETKDGYITVECGAPVAAFSADVTAGEAPLTVQFTDESVAAAGCDITGWEWSYGPEGGDQTTVDEQNPSITFKKAGVYQVSLTVTNAAGSDEETKTAYITVTEPGDDDTIADDDDDNDDAFNDQTDDDNDDDSGCGC